MPLEIRPLNAAIGAEVHGIDLAHVSESESEIAEVHEAWLAWKVLFFRDQAITRDEHIAFGRRFGPLEKHPFIPDGTEHPEIVVIESNARQTYAAAMWHSDVTWRKEPSMGSILRGCIIPPLGGDTCFANASLAYDRLSEEILGHLERAIMDPSVQCRFHWAVDSFAMWDNRATQHFATNDFFPETRRVERVTIVGDAPY